MAVRAGQVAAGLSRRTGRGHGSTIGGRVTLALDRSALRRVVGDRRTALVSGTNGKTTTTRLVAAALATAGEVDSNTSGANLLAGLVAALADSAVRPDGADLAALEVDEGLLARSLELIRPHTVTLLNLSRDQLDRVGEVRANAASWRRALGRVPGVAVVANADDPLVVWAARAARRVTWVGTGQRWRLDAATCPACGNRIVWSAHGHHRGGPRWHCAGCRRSRPRPDLWLEGDEVVTHGGGRVGLELGLPGWCNRANATMALATARTLGVDLRDGAAAMASVRAVEGRYEVIDVGDVRVRLLLAKNPAGWAETLDLLRPAPAPVVVGINARGADGHDPSWLWDVDFARLAGRTVVATGERGRDLAVRLRYAGIAHVWAAGWREALALATTPGPPGQAATEVDLACNYTAFQAARLALGRIDQGRIAHE